MKFKNIIIMRDSGRGSVEDKYQWPVYAMHADTSGVCYFGNWTFNPAGYNAKRLPFSSLVIGQSTTEMTGEWNQERSLR